VTVRTLLVFYCGDDSGLRGTSTITPGQALRVGGIYRVARKELALIPQTPRIGGWTYVLDPILVDFVSFPSTMTFTTFRPVGEGRERQTIKQTLPCKHAWAYFRDEASLLDQLDLTAHLRSAGQSLRN
jgi:hypothetical protein